MNATRRKQITEAQGLYDEGKAKLEECSAALQEVMDEEQEAFDNLSESLQGGERGETMQSCIDALQAGIDSLDELDVDFDAMRG